jgi:DNA-binding beta-propeller fold protein YncE
MPIDVRPRVDAVQPAYACPGGIVTLHGSTLSGDGTPPRITLDDVPVQAVFVSPSRLSFRVPTGLAGGRSIVHVDGAATAPVSIVVARVFATGVHQVDNPVFDDEGLLYLTYSGSRGQHVPVSIFRVNASGARESFSSAIVNPTSMAWGPDGALYVSSRFEGTVYRVLESGDAVPHVSDVGAPCGLAFDAEGSLYVGDRSGTVFRVMRGKEPAVVATLPPSVAAFHLAVGRDGWLYVTAPTLSAYDSVYRVSADGRVETLSRDFGRPQGLAFDPDGNLHVVDALAGAGGLFVLEGGERHEVVSGEGLIGVAFDPSGGLALASADTIYRFDDRPPWSQPAARREDR